MIIKNISGENLFLGWIDKQGIELSVNEEQEVNDVYVYSDEMSKAVNADLLTIISYSSEEEGMTSNIKAMVIKNSLETLSGINRLSLSSINGNETCKLYYTDKTNKTIWRMNIDGTIREAIATGLTGLMHIKIYNNELYFITSIFGGVHKLSKMAIDGGAITDIKTGLTDLMDFQICDNKIYISPMMEKELLTMDLDGSNEATIPFSQFSCYFAICRSLKKIYIANGSDSIYKTDLNGANQELVFPSAGSVTGIDIDEIDGKIYWCERTATKIWRANFDGTEKESLYTSGMFPDGISVNHDQGLVAWVTVGGSKITSAKMDGSGIIHEVDVPQVGQNMNVIFREYNEIKHIKEGLTISKSLCLVDCKSGANQAAAGAIANELWIDTADNSIKIGV